MYVKTRLNKKGLPYAMEAEQSALGALLLDPIYVIPHFFGVLREDDFFVTAHKAIYKTVLSLHQKGMALDPVTVVAALKDEDMVLVQGRGYIVELIENTPTAANVKYYIRILKNEGERRRKILKATADLEKAYTEDIAVKKDWVCLKDVLGEILDECYETGPDRLSGISTGLDTLDEYFDGLQKGRVYIIAGRPSMGKSAMCAQMALHIRSEGGRVLFVPIEVGSKAVARNILANASGVPVWKYKKKRGQYHTDEEKGLLYGGIKLIQNEIGYMAISESNTCNGIESVMHDILFERGGLDIVFIDHLQEMLPDMSDNNNKRHYQLEGILRDLRRLAREYNIPVVLAAQIGRDTEKNDREPTVADLKDSGSIEQIADVVLILHGKRGEDKRIANIAKNREGPCKKIALHLRGELLRFEERENF